MNLLVRILFCILWYGISLIAYNWIHWYEGEIIVEIGYRSPLPSKTVIRNQSHSFADKLVYWNLCRCAKKNSRNVWVYFIMNILAYITAVVSTILFAQCLFMENMREAFRMQMGWLLYAIMFIFALHFFLDISLVPSVQKKYGIKYSKKKNKQKE